MASTSSLVVCCLAEGSLLARVYRSVIIFTGIDWHYSLSVPLATKGDMPSSSSSSSHQKMDSWTLRHDDDEGGDRNAREISKILWATWERPSFHSAKNHTIYGSWGSKSRIRTPPRRLDWTSWLPAIGQEVPLMVLTWLPNYIGIRIGWPAHMFRGSDKKESRGGYCHVISISLTWSVWAIWMLTRCFS